MARGGIGFVVVLLVVVATAAGRCAPAPAKPRGATPPAGKAKDRVTERDALKKVMALPEVGQFALYLQKQTKGRVHLTVREEGRQAGAWQFYVGESHPDHTVVWNRFRVHADTGAISVLDVVADKWVSLAQWRKGRAAR